MPRVLTFLLGLLWTFSDSTTTLKPTPSPTKKPCANTYCENGGTPHAPNPDFPQTCICLCPGGNQTCRPGVPWGPLCQCPKSCSHGPDNGICEHGGRPYGIWNDAMEWECDCNCTPSEFGPYGMTGYTGTYCHKQRCFESDYTWQSASLIANETLDNSALQQRMRKYWDLSSALKVCNSAKWEDCVTEVERLVLPQIIGAICNEQESFISPGAAVCKVAKFGCGMVNEVLHCRDGKETKDHRICGFPTDPKGITKTSESKLPESFCNDTSMLLPGYAHISFDACNVAFLNAFAMKILGSENPTSFMSVDCYLDSIANGTDPVHCAFNRKPLAKDEVRKYLARRNKTIYELEGGLPKVEFLEYFDHIASRVGGELPAGGIWQRLANWTQFAVMERVPIDPGSNEGGLSDAFQIDVTDMIIAIIGGLIVLALLPYFFYYVTKPKMHRIAEADDYKRINQ